MARDMARRFVVGIASAALVALTLVPAGAGPTVTGTIVMATGGSPAAARMAYVVNNYRNVGDEPSQTWALGYVVCITRTVPCQQPGPAGPTHFKIAPVVAGTVGDFDIFFYDGAQFPEGALPNEDEADKWAGPGAHCDALPGGARWAIVTLSIGAADQFALQFNNGAIAC